MPYITNKHGEYTLEQAVEGVKGVDIPGGSGICTACTVTWNYTAQHPEHAGYTVAVIGYPGNVSDDGLGEAGALRTFIQDSDDPHLWFPGPINTEDEGSFLALTFHMDISVTGVPPEPDEGVAEITLNCTMLDSTDPTDFPGTEILPAPNGGDPPDVDLTDPNKPILTFTSGSALPEDEDGVVIERSKEGGEFPWDIAGVVVPGVTFPNYTFPDNLTDNGFDKAPGIFIYRLRTFKLDPPSGPSLSPPTDPTDPFSFPEDPDTISYTGTLTLDMDWISTMSFITDPSGIYTLVQGQAFDRLYNRGGEEYIDVAIPNPTIRTADF